MGWLIAILLIVVIFPFSLALWLITLPFDRNRTLIHTILNYHSAIIAALIPLWTVTVEGREKADPKGTYVIVSNHQSILDILIINCLRYRLKWVSKIENLKVPLLGFYLWMADYIIIDRGNPQSREKLYSKASKFLSRGISIMLFPEGTRSLDGDIHPFRRGAFKLAIENNVPILPILIDGTGGILPKKGFYIKGGHQIKLKVLDPIYPKDFPGVDHDGLAVICRNIMAEGFEKFKLGDRK